MIVNLEQASPDDLSGFGVAVIGSGFAGIETALRLADRRVRVILAESGRERIEAAYQDLLKLDIAGRPLAGKHNFNAHLDDPLNDAGRVRAFGGTSAIWSGRWKRLDASDFLPKPWVPLSGWPIKEQDIRPYYRSVERDYKLPDFDLFSDKVRFIARDALRPVFRFDQKKWPTRLAGEALIRLRQHPNILVLLGATATEVALADDLVTVDHIVLSARDSTHRQLRTKSYVIACGGLETPRLMLASNRQIAAGVGNQNDQVGRYYMDHPKLRVGEFKLQNADSHFRPGGRKPRFSAGFALSDSVQAAHRLLNHSLYLTHPVKPPRPPSSIRYLAARLRRKLARPDKIMPTFYLEQAPNPDSRITLSERTDALGMRGICLDWRFTDLDRISLQDFAAQFAEIAKSVGVGTYRFDPDELDLDLLSNANHPMGTTRMADNPKLGVVDKDCKVFGLTNLFVAGSSVFATAGNANPTYTIVCLARRLGDHLAAKFGDRHAP